MKRALLVAQPKEVTNNVRELGFEPISCADCVQAIRMAIKENPSLIIAHADHPVVSGIEMSQFLSLFQLYFPIVLIAKNPDDFNAIQVDLPIVSRAEALAGLDDFIIAAIEENQNHNNSFNYQLRQREWMDLLSGDPRPRVLIGDTGSEILGQGRGLLDNYEQYYIFSAKNGLETVIKTLLLKPQLVLVSAYFSDIRGLQISQIFYLFGLTIPVVLLVNSEDKDTKMAAFRSFGVMNVQDKDLAINTHEFLDLIDGHLGMNKGFKDFARPVTPEELAYQESDRVKRAAEQAAIEAQLPKVDASVFAGGSIDKEVLADIQGLVMADTEDAPATEKVIKKVASLAGMRAVVSNDFQREYSRRNSKGLAGLF
ncbi:MAG: hypothetical protein QNL04_01945 [SAR324 cluster bacterium]|nr:hypothetical protein [SAR324 cluster bacterium]